MRTRSVVVVLVVLALVVAVAVGVAFAVRRPTGRPCLLTQNLDDHRCQPIAFAYPSAKAEQYRWCRTVPKDRDFSEIVPGQTAYAFTDEKEYMGAYAKCYYAITMKKGGWDCLRHYEILAAGCIPYFIDLHRLPAGTMHNFPVQLVQKSMRLPGVPRNLRPDGTLALDWRTFSVSKYEECRRQLLHHFDTVLLTQYLPRHMGLQVKRVGIRCQQPWNYVDYMRDMLCIGLLENSIHLHVDNFDVDYVFNDTKVDTAGLYGRGMTISRSVPAQQRQFYHLGGCEMCDVIILSTQSNSGVDLRQAVPGKKNLILDGNDIGGSHPALAPGIDACFVREIGAVQPSRTAPPAGGTRP